MVETTIIAQLGGEMTPSLMSSIQEPAVMTSVVGIIMGLVLLGLLISVILWIGRRICPRSTEYRKLLVDMYVVGMVKKFSKEDDIDLTKPIKVKDLYLQLGGIDKLLEWLNDNLLNKHIIIQDVDVRGQDRIVVDGVVSKFSKINLKDDKTIMHQIEIGWEDDIFTLDDKPHKGFSVLLNDMISLKKGHQYSLDRFI